MIDYLAIINKYCAGNEELKTILITHSRQVADRALLILSQHPEWIESGLVDPVFVEEAAMLHDIGVTLCDAPRIHCLGTHQYIEHGYLGAQILREEGLPKHAAVAERHTGTGLKLTDIITRELPVPHRELCPVSLEEQLICYADKFFSKTRLDSEDSYERVKKKMQKWGNESVEQLRIWQEKFE